MDKYLKLTTTENQVVHVNPEYIVTVERILALKVHTRVSLVNQDILYVTDTPEQIFSQALSGTLAAKVGSANGT